MINKEWCEPWMVLLYIYPAVEIPVTPPPTPTPPWAYGYPTCVLLQDVPVECVIVFTYERHLCSDIKGLHASVKQRFLLRVSLHIENMPQAHGERRTDVALQQNNTCRFCRACWMSPYFMSQTLMHTYRATYRSTSTAPEGIIVCHRGTSFIYSWSSWLAIPQLAMQLKTLRSDYYQWVILWVCIKLHF